VRDRQLLVLGTQYRDAASSDAEDHNGYLEPSTHLASPFVSL
jgi:hypothetical protein